ncbi:hypothetical protein [Burkholderia ubonensis]|uniref:hypothetical protein n=1 Tax=Burkholderia ubonensis TaxID=101571 RepID=UPI00075912BB|nr:hypothetical protein [Burkholderia ubonensis]KVX77016.1 EsaK [Burkholderia ubonensis]
MTYLPISITYLPGPAPSESLIPAATLSGYFDAASILEQAQSRAAALLDEATNQRAAAERDARQFCEDARQRWLSAATAELEQARQDLIGETIQWLADEADIEARIAENLDDRLRVLIASVVEPYLRERDAVELLLERVRTRIATEHGRQPLVLHVGTTSAERIRTALHDEPRVRVLADVTLGDSEARLESPHVIVRFNLEQHLSLLISRLTACTPEPSIDGERN